jgi:hypothetical protein
MKRRLLSIFCALALCLTLLPAAALAADGPTVLYVGDTQVDVNGTDGTTSGEGWFYADGVLTLGGVNLAETHSCSDDFGNIAAAGIYAEDDLTIVLEGENSISDENEDDSAGIFVKGDLTIRGDGTLTIYDVEYGIFASVGVNITGGTVYAIGSEEGISAVSDNDNATVTIGGDAQVYAEGFSEGISAEIWDYGDATVTIRGDAQVYAGEGIDAYVFNNSGDASVTISGNARVYAGEGIDATNYGSGDASVDISGSVQVYAGGNGAGILAYSPSDGDGISSVIIDRSDVTLQCGSTENVIYADSLSIGRGSSVTVTPGSTLDLTDEDTVYDIASGTLINNGTLVVSGEDTIASLDPDGAGLVQAGGRNYSNSGAALTEVNGPIEVSVGTPSAGQTYYTWEPGAGGVWTLTLDGVYVDSNIIIDAQGADEIVIDTINDSVVEMPYTGPLSLTGEAGGVERYSLGTGNGGAEMYSDLENYDYYFFGNDFGIVLGNADNCTVTMTGEPLAVLGGGILLDGDGNTLVVDRGAQVSACGVTLGSSEADINGIVQINGILISNLQGFGFGLGGINAGYVEIGSDGWLIAAGPEGLALTGIEDAAVYADFENALVLRQDGRLTAFGAVAAVLVGGGGRWPGSPDRVIVGLPGGFSAKWNSAKNFCSITKELPLDDSLLNALKMLDIYGTAGDDEPDNPPIIPDRPGDDDDDDETAYPIFLSTGEGGSVHSSHRTAEAETEVTLTITPDDNRSLRSLTAVSQRTGEVLDLEYQGGGKYTFEMPASEVLVEILFTEDETQPFADVPESYWAYSEITWAWENGYMSGTSATTFSPDGTVSRQQVWMILARMAGDSPTDMAAAKAWAVANGISDGTDPGGAVTRQQLAALLYRYAVLYGYDVSVGENTNILSFTDVGQLSEYAIPAMQWAVGAGIINGTGDGSTLTPQGDSTRAQLAVMLYRFMGSM